ncbi:DUF2971 domain-containing protein [Flavobacterium aciduliphilum]|uniref:DUF2971 family protein n=1 Tax=Flavobacterium aciduliphilum TaxID=1101402 RepID=A0A328YJE2_9FLAO|nr:DUF2971 domain-containing protein [Flavobacterium aciduliphilum]RAR74171.1 Protein of unknown function (DUF2971) [Flavobacterium aciduliphilum]
MKIQNNEDASQMADKFLDVVFKPFFPKARYKSKFMMSGESPPTSFKGEISNENLFDETKYKLEPKKELLHFTTLQGLNSILETGYFRLSSIENLSDNLELILGLNRMKEELNIEISDDTISNLKQNIFCLSSCLNTPETITDTYMWENYSNRGSGAVLVFEVENVNLNLLFGKVLYGNENLTIFDDLKNSIIKHKNNFGGFMPNNLYEMMSKIFCFHKANKFHRENEVRLLIKENKNNIYDDHNNLFIDKIINSQNEVRYIYKLVLQERIEDWYNKNYSHRENITLEDAQQKLPKIKIKKIVLGYNIKNTYEIRQFLIEKRKKLSMNFDIEIINSDLQFFT